MSKKGFYVQLHLHTSETSACGKSSGAEMARACKEAGYDLIYITDHFIDSNIACDDDLPWNEKVEFLMRGWRAAKAEGDRIGLEVQFGWETFNGKIRSGKGGQELLTYGLGEDFLLANPDLDKLGYYDYIRRVTDAGGTIIHAHPHRKDPRYIPDFTPDPLSVEAYEVYNALNRPENANELALAEAKKYGLLCFAGADAHRTIHVGLGAMRFEKPVHSVKEMFEAMRGGDGQIIEVMPPINELT